MSRWEDAWAWMEFMRRYFVVVGAGGHHGSAAHGGGSEAEGGGEGRPAASTAGEDSNGTKMKSGAAAAAAASSCSSSSLNPAVPYRLPQSLTIKALYLYPIKSCAAFAPPSGTWPTAEHGLYCDREWGLMGPEGRVLSQVTALPHFD